jgi:hypothetical protein
MSKPKTQKKSGPIPLQGSQTYHGSIDWPVELWYPGRPALAKNSRDMRMVFSPRLKRLVPVPTLSKNFAHAIKVGLPRLKEQWGNRAAIGDKEHRLHVKAYFLAGKGAVPDLDGCMVGCGDLLQRAGIISNDKWIASWDGTRIIEWRTHMKEESTVIKINLYKEDE